MSEYTSSQQIKLFRASKQVDFCKFIDWFYEQGYKKIERLEVEARKMYGSKEFENVKVNSKKKIKLVKRD